MAAATVANLLKIRKETIRKSLEHFQGVEHRLENVLTINKVKYINDSKATNVNATYYALESMESPTVWIVGGVDKGNNYADLNKVVNKRVKAIICLGLNNLKIMDHFENVVEYIVEAKSMDEAVNAAYKYHLRVIVYCYLQLVLVLIYLMILRIEEDNLKQLLENYSE